MCFVYVLFTIVRAAQVGKKKKKAKPSTRSKISILFRTLGSEVYHSYSGTQYGGKAVLRSLSSLKAPSPFLPHPQNILYIYSCHQY